MISTKTLGILGLATLVLFAAAGVIGEDRDVLWIVDDISWYGFLGCALALILMTLAMLLRAATRSRGASR